MSTALFVAFTLLALSATTSGAPGIIRDGPSLCRNLPGDPLFPTDAQWVAYNKTIGGRLLAVVPSAEFCHGLPGGDCTEEMWTSTDFRTTVPGAMVNYNWEQDYLSIPPSLCLQNGTTCGQGNVPVFGVNATEASHIQAGVKFAVAHNLKVAIKASGHDFLGRSTAQGSLLLWTHHLQNISFTDNFFVGGKNMGSAMTTGSGVPVNRLYEASKAVGKFFTGASTATAVASGGYVQGAGHSAFAKVFGLAADNALEFEIVLANGSLVKANEIENPDLFWALRGGGAGSWGVIISTTFRTFPTFPAVQHSVSIVTPTNASTGQLAEVHARHIFDLTESRAGQYFTFFAGTPETGNLLTLSTFFPNTTADEAKAIMKPMLDDARAMNASVSEETLTPGLANDLMFFSDTSFGINDILGSRLIPMEAYRTNVAAIGAGVTELFEKGVVEILGHNLLGGQVAENANVDNAVNPKWRQAQTHFIAASQWPDSLSPPGVEQVKQTMTNVWVPIIAKMTNETDSASYSNEADVREPNFQVTFFGVNYPRLKQIKNVYDPQNLFIVPAGVGSEDWDVSGSCRTVI